MPPGRGLVQGLTFSSDAGLLRLIAVLKGPVTVTKAGLIPGSGGALSRRLVVDVTPASGPDFAAALGNGPIDSNPPIVIGGAEAAGVADRRPDARSRTAAPAQGSLLSVVDNSSVVPALRPGTVNKLSAGLGSSTYTAPSSTSAVLQASTTSSVVPLASSGSDSRGDNPLAQHRADPAARIGARRRLAPDLYRSRPWRPRSRDHRHDRHL